MHGKNALSKPSRYTVTTRVELIAFPDSVGDSLRQEISHAQGFPCLRIREKPNAATLSTEANSAVVNCVWVECGTELSEIASDGTFIAVGEGYSGQRIADIIAVGYNAVIDLLATEIPDAARLIGAYYRQINRSAELRSQSSSAASTPLALPGLSGGGTAFLAAAVEHLATGVYLLDSKAGGRICVWNREMERLFQLDKNQALGQHVETLFEDPLVRSIFQDMPVAYTRSRAIFPSKGAARNNFIADISKTQLQGADGQPLAVVGFIQDVTNRIQSENRLITAFNDLETSKEKLEQSNLEIRKGIEKAKKLAVVAQSSNKAKSYFLSNISHELRTPLNSIVSLTHALLEGTFGKLHPLQQENLEIVSDSSKHLQSLINDILDLSKIELGKMSLKFASTNVEDVARSSIRMIEQEAAQKKVSCILEMRTERDSIDVDAKRLRQILLNLLVNAVKFTKPSTQVILRIEEDPDTQSLVFRVIDHGIGIDEADFAKIFSPFTQLDDSLSRQYEGTGLGLAIASKFVELHGGGLQVVSKTGEGSTFKVTLPLKQPREEGEPALRASLSEVATSTKAPGNLLLIVDENDLSALRIKNQVQRFTTLRPILALPNEISAYHDQISPKAIFVDIGIIASHGTDWITNAKKLAAWKKTKWIAIGSLDLPDNHAAARRLGFDACCCKPLSDSLLSQTLR